MAHNESENSEINISKLDPRELVNLVNKKTEAMIQSLVNGDNPPCIFCGGVLNPVFNRGALYGVSCNGCKFKRLHSLTVPIDE